MNRSTTPKQPAKENDQYREAVQRIATALGETNAQPLAHIRRIVRMLGEARAQQLLTQAQAVDQGAGERRGAHPDLAPQALADEAAEALGGGRGPLRRVPTMGAGSTILT